MFATTEDERLAEDERRAEAIYECVVRPTLHPNNEGKYVAIAVESEDFEVDASDYAAASRRARLRLMRTGQRRRTGCGVCQRTGRDRSGRGQGASGGGSACASTGTGRGRRRCRYGILWVADAAYRLGRALGTHQTCGWPSGSGRWVRWLYLVF
jgi:hypothetical protein